ncbi:acyl-CoA N-acyltransferase [Xylaria acuta]|nr:acyl-CoA N-acyltransferase [Xylaria acuta]
MATLDKDAVLVEVIDNAEDFTEGYRCISEAFGRQTHDGIWTAFNPGWETPEGQAAGADRMVQRWRSVTTDNKGNPNTVFLKATLPDPEQPQPGPGGRRRVIVGFAVWVQASAVEGYGNMASDDAEMDLEALYPGNETEQRFLRQMLRSLTKRRVEFVRGKAAADPPCIMALDLCVTHPAFQRRGVASKLVRWGLDEARRRGIPDATTEASSMGRHAYGKLGFRPQGSDIVYEVDDEFSGRDKPPNIFMVYSSELIE